MLAAAAACQPNTTRPAFSPVPEAAGTEVRLPMSQATQRLAEALKADSIPVRKVQIRGVVDQHAGRARCGSHDFPAGRIGRSRGDPRGSERAPIHPERVPIHSRERHRMIRGDFPLQLPIR